MAFILFQVWAFPVDWPWHVTAAAFHADYEFEQGRPFTTDDLPGSMRGTDAVFRVLKHRRDEELPIEDLTAAAIAAGWSPQGKNPKRAWALRCGTRSRHAATMLAMPGAASLGGGGSARPAFVTRTKKISWPGCWPILNSTKSFRRLMAECDAEEDDDEGLDSDGSFAAGDCH